MLVSQVLVMSAAPLLLVPLLAQPIVIQELTLVKLALQILNALTCSYTLIVSHPLVSNALQTLNVQVATPAPVMPAFKKPPPSNVSP